MPPEAPEDKTGNTPPAASLCLKTMRTRPEFLAAAKARRQGTSSMMVQAIGVLPQNLYASPGYLTKSPPLRSPADLLSHRCLVMASGDRTVHWTLTQEDEHQDLNVTGAVIVNDFPTLRNLAVADGGIALLPAYAVTSECRSGALQPVLPNWAAAEATLSAIYPSRRGATLKQRAFIDCVKKVVEDLSVGSST